MSNRAMHESIPDCWAPFELAWDDAPVDLSFVFAEERPAGKRGFLMVQGSRFVFEDGTEGRFWGTCFNSSANFPEHDQSEMVARRLAKFGVNMVRLHQMDAEWSTPNLFQFNRADGKDNTRSLDPTSLDRVDYLISCLKEQGIYIYLDLLTYRQFRPGDGVDSVEELPQAAKPYTYFDPTLIALQKEFNEQLWTHVNPYTGLAYKDDPAIALTELKNESDLITQPVVLEPYRSRLEARYRAWADERGLPVAADAVDFAVPDAQIAAFFLDVQQACYRELSDHLRAIGVRVPITGTNWSRTLMVAASHAESDFTDSHVYWNFPRWTLPDGNDPLPLVESPETPFATLSVQRFLDRPFFVSEWDHAWPDPWRAESPLLYAAIGAFQGWSGATIHTYRYRTDGPVDRIGGGSSTINGIVYRNHFDAFNDPAKFGLFYHAALLLRRGDVRPAEQEVTVEVDPESTPDWLLKRAPDIPALQRLCEHHRVGMGLPDMPHTTDQTVPAHETAIDTTVGEVRSDTGELWRSWRQGIGWIDTARTKAAYGFLAEAEAVTLDGLDLDVRTSFATIALSSLSDDPIADSTSMLLTAVGRCDNSGVRYEIDDAGNVHQLDFGHGPIMIEPIEATISVRTSHPHLKVWVIGDRGQTVVALPTTYEHGKLSFTIGKQPFPNPSTIYYLLTH